MARAVSSEDAAVNELVAANLRALKAFHAYTDETIAAGMGTTRSWVRERMSGTTPCKAADLRRFAIYFDVPLSRLFDSGTAHNPRYVKNRRVTIPLSVFDHLPPIFAHGKDLVKV